MIVILFKGISTKMAQNNAFTVAKRTLEGQDMIYQSIKLTNGIWALVGKQSVSNIHRTRTKTSIDTKEEGGKLNFCIQ